VPKARSGRGQEAVECAAAAGLHLDDWQKLVLDGALRTSGGKWAALEVGVDVARQNGKGGLLEARELAGLFCFGERMITHSAHQFDTSLEAFRRLLMLIEDTPEFDKQVKRVSRSHGEEGIELKSRQRIRFRTRTKGGGRGFTGDLVLLDEAMFLPEVAIAALLPTLSARPNPQVWYTGSAVDQTVHQHGSVFSRIRRRGIAGEGGIAYFEWSAPYELDEVAEHLDDPEVWRLANPAMGIRINERFVETERRAMDSRSFAVERLGVGDWPEDGEEDRVLDFDAWSSLRDDRSYMVDPVCYALDVTPARDHGVIMAAGLRPDGLFHTEMVDYRRGTGWMASRLAEILPKRQWHSVTLDKRSPAAALIRPLENLGIPLETPNTQEIAEACGAFYDLVQERRIRHLGTDELNGAVKNAATRPLGDAWAWSRKLSAADIGPLVAATLAVWQATENLSSVYDERGVLAL
jgi:phage terminase large subunit-like protein